MAKQANESEEVTRVSFFYVRVYLCVYVCVRILSVCAHFFVYVGAREYVCMRLIFLIFFICIRLCVFVVFPVMLYTG